MHSFFNINNFVYGVGLELSTPKDKYNNEIKNLPHISVNNLKLYSTPINFSKRIDNEWFRRKGKLVAYKAPHILCKEGIKEIEYSNGEKDKRIVASYIEYDCSFYKGIIGITSYKKDELKILTAYFNSSFAKYYMFLTSSSWGIERDAIKYNELFNLPNIFESNTKKKNRVLFLIEKLLKRLNQIRVIIPDIKDIEELIDSTISKILNLTHNEEILINDIINYNIDLFYKGDKALGLQPINHNNSETIPYARMLCSEINDFLKVGNYKVNASVYKFNPNIPLCIIIIRFDSQENAGKINIIESDRKFKEHLLKINKYTLEKYSENIYFHKHVRYYDGNDIFIIKPNQKRFWTQSQAMEDAQNLISEILHMRNEKYN